MKVATLCLAMMFGLLSTGADAGNGKAYGSDNGGGNRGGDGGDGNGNAGGHDKGAAGVTVYSPQGLVTIGAEQNIALDAVKSGDALPLDRIEPAALRRWGGRLIDARLIRVNDMLLYRLTILSDTGVSRRVYYNARTGAPIAGQ